MRRGGDQDVALTRGAESRVVKWLKRSSIRSVGSGARAERGRGRRGQRRRRRAAGEQQVNGDAEAGTSGRRRLPPIVDRPAAGIRCDASQRARSGMQGRQVDHAVAIEQAG